MIVFDLRCDDGCAVFEGWFDSSADFQRQFERGLVQCPYCGSPKVGKAPMAPRVGRSGGSQFDVKDVIAEVAAFQARMLSNSEWVGTDLPDTARAMHLGEIEKRQVHGEASADEARSLIDEGVPIMPLPLPVVPPRQVN
ncbi:MAG TPA: DUF1178 family protein [Sphingomicrobium sp.]|nr:DUF1178 family protein [Sphingomicrobium sp.]